MKHWVLLSFLLSSLALADTPPPGTVKAKTFSGDGNTAITATGTSLNVNVTNSGGLNTVDQGAAGTDPWVVDVTNSVLPANACQEEGGNLESILAKLNATIAVTGTFWPVLQPVVVASPLPAGSNTIGKVDVNGTIPISAASPIPISATSMPLPAGAATETTLSSINTKTPALGQALSAASVPVVLPAAQISTLTPLSTVTANQGTAGAQSWLVDGSSHTQPISAAALPLPSGAATVAKQPALGTAGTASSDVITVQGITSMTPLKVDASGTTVPISIASPVPVTGTFWQATQPISAAALPLPSGAATEATLADVKTAVASIDTKTPALGQALSAASVPVVLPAAQISTLTPLSTVTANIGTSGSLALDASVTGLQVAQNSTTSGQTGSLAQGAVTTSAPSYTTARTSPLSLTTAGGLRVDGSGVTQPISIAAALPSGTNIIGRVGIDQTTPGTTNGVQVNAALPAGSAVIGKVSIDQTTPGTTNLVALAANQSVNQTQIGGASVSVGNGTSDSGTQRVAIASNNTAFSVNATPIVPAAVTVKQAAVTIGTSAVRLTTDGSAPSSTRVLLAAQLISSSTAACFFGSSGVTASSTTRGVQMAPGQVFSFNNDAGDYYAICDAATQTFLITEQE